MSIFLSSQKSMRRKSLSRDYGEISRRSMQYFNRSPQKMYVLCRNGYPEKRFSPEDMKNLNKIRSLLQSKDVPFNWVINESLCYIEIQGKNNHATVTIINLIKCLSCEFDLILKPRDSLKDIDIDIVIPGIDNGDIMITDFNFHHDSKSYWRTSLNYLDVGSQMTNVKLIIPQLSALLIRQGYSLKFRDEDVAYSFSSDQKDIIEGLSTDGRIKKPIPTKITGYVNKKLTDEESCMMKDGQAHSADISSFTGNATVEAISVESTSAYSLPKLQDHLKEFDFKVIRPKAQAYKPDLSENRSVGKITVKRLQKQVNSKNRKVQTAVLNQQQYPKVSRITNKNQTIYLNSTDPDRNKKAQELVEKE